MKFSPQFAESYSAYFLKIILKLTLSAQPILPEIVYLLFLALIFNFNLHFIIRFFLWLFIYFANIHTHTHVRRLLRCIQAQIDTLRSVTETVATYLQEDWSSLLVMLTPAAAATAVSTWYSANRTCLLPNHFPYYLPPN